MGNFVTLLFAFRNRDMVRVENSFESLKKQTSQQFRVIFVDYGSKKEYSEALKKLLTNYSFVDYYGIGHEGLLWNKSKAFNFGIRKSESDFVFTADIDLIFSPDFIEKMNSIKDPNSFCLFSYGYLNEFKAADKLRNRDFDKLEPSHYGKINGAGLYPKKGLEGIRGFDEFYHFYGSEDEDLFLRLRNSGLQQNLESENYLLHQWHPRYPDVNDHRLTSTPRVSNIRRINQQHFFQAVRFKRIMAEKQEDWGDCYSHEDRLLLLKPVQKFEVGNKASEVIHFLNEVLPFLKGRISVVFGLHPIYQTPKYYYRKLRKKNFEPYLSMKEVNDEVLKEIVFRYRHCNYSFEVGDNLKSIKLSIQLD